MSFKLSNIVPMLIIGSSAFLLSACSNKNLSNTNIDLNKNDSTSNTQMTPPTNTAKPSTANKDNNSSFVSIKTANGEIILKLYADKTPNTVKNFINKANSGFYKGLNFHRVIPGFMAQGGDPTGTGMGGGQQASELNNVPFKRGSIGLARTPETNKISNDSQFFICFNDTGCQHLTGDYVNFGEVVSGFEVLDKITQGDKIIDITSQTK